MNILKKPIIREIIADVICLILIILYFICFNTQVITLEQSIKIKYINISSMVFLAIAIIMFEVGYRKNKLKIFINGAEFLVFAIVVLLIKQIPKSLGYTVLKYTEIMIYTFIAYYILKAVLMYTKQKHDELESLSDIKEIVKEEPQKKPTKRKNIKTEEQNIKKQ